MFKKNSMEFFVALSYYLYYFTVAVCQRLTEDLNPGLGSRELFRVRRELDGVLA